MKSVLVADRTDNKLTVLEISRIREDTAADPFRCRRRRSFSFCEDLEVVLRRHQLINSKVLRVQSA